MSSSILTPLTLWQDFDDTLPLKEAVIKTLPIGGADFNYIYFSGRQAENGRVRIYGLYAKQKTEPLGSILILPDSKDSIDQELVLNFSNLGYDVLCVDYRGEFDNSTDFTKYPTDVEYANYLKCDRSFNFVDKTAKETCWYEWTSVARYAISFLKNKNPSKKIGVIGIKQGANVLWQLASMDKRVDASIFLFGAGWLAYKNLFKLEGNNIEIDDERTKFLAGIESQAYAQYVECPVLYLTTTNCDEFDSERAMDTLLRLKNPSESHINFVTNAKSVLNLKSLKNCEIFLAKYVSGVKLNLGQPKIEIDFDGEDILYSVSSTRKADITSVQVFSSFNDISPKERIWYNVLNYTKNKSGVYKFRQRILGECNMVIAFAIVNYSNGFTASTSYCYSKNVDYVTSSVFPSVLFSSSKMPTTFIVEDIKTELIGNVFSNDKLYSLKEGPCGIYGIYSENTLTSYAVRKIASRLNDDSFIKFDLYLKNNDTLTVKLITESKVEYVYTLPVESGEFWHNIQLPLSDFKSNLSQSIKDFDKITSISISSIGSFMINNFIII